MNKNWTWVIFCSLLALLGIFLLSSVSAQSIEDALHLNIQTTDESGNVITGTFEFQTNITNSSDCTNVLYTDTQTKITDSRGIVFLDLENINLDFSKQYSQCIYADGVLQSNVSYRNVPYAFYARNTSWAGISGIPQSVLNTSAVFLRRDGGNSPNATINWGAQNVTNMSNLFFRSASTSGLQFWGGQRIRASTNQILEFIPGDTFRVTDLTGDRIFQGTANSFVIGDGLAENAEFAVYHDTGEVTWQSNRAQLRWESLNDVLLQFTNSLYFQDTAVELVAETSGNLKIITNNSVNITTKNTYIRNITFLGLGRGLIFPGDFGDLIVHGAEVSAGGNIYFPIGDTVLMGRAITETVTGQKTYTNNNIHNGNDTFNGATVEFSSGTTTNVLGDFFVADEMCRFGDSNTCWGFGGDRIYGDAGGDRVIDCNERGGSNEDDCQFATISGWNVYAGNSLGNWTTYSIAYFNSSIFAQNLPVEAFDNSTDYCLFVSGGDGHLYLNQTCAGGSGGGGGNITVEADASVLYTNLTQITQGGGSEEVINNYTIPGDSIREDGDFLEYTIAGTTSGTSGKRYRIYLGGTIILDSGSTSFNTEDDWEIKGTIAYTNETFGGSPGPEGESDLLYGFAHAKSSVVFLIGDNEYRDTEYTFLPSKNWSASQELVMTVDADGANEALKEIFLIKKWNMNP